MIQRLFAVQIIAFTPLNIFAYDGGMLAFEHSILDEAETDLKNREADNL